MLMKECGVDLEDKSLQILLRFLVHINDLESDLLWKLIKRMNDDKSVIITHIECIAMSYIALQKVDKSRRLLSLFQPMYKNENYIFVHPGVLSQVINNIILLHYKKKRNYSLFLVGRSSI
jgi:hypothetical protein